MLPTDDTALRQQLAASQAREQQLRDALENAAPQVAQNIDYWCGRDAYMTDADYLTIKEALALPQDTSVLEAMIAKAGEVMRERCVDVIGPYGKTRYLTSYEEGCDDTKAGIDTEIRALPGVTLEDLK